MPDAAALSGAMRWQWPFPAAAEQQASSRGVTAISSAGRSSMSWSEFHATSAALATRLAPAVGSGGVVVMLGPTSLPLLIGIGASWLLGAAISVAPLRGRVQSGLEYLEQLRARVSLVEPSAIVFDDSDEELVDALNLGASAPRLPFSLVMGLESKRHDEYLGAESTPPDRAIIQFTSGSTDTARAVVISAAALHANLAGITSHLAMGDDEAIVSWLPLYHDMGLIATFALAMHLTADFVVSSPAEFVTTPFDWLHWMADSRATYTAAPQFAFEIMARRLARHAPPAVDLSRLKWIVNGGECINPTAFQSFARGLIPTGLRESALTPAYGMAETTVATTTRLPGTGLGIDVVDADRLEREGLAALTSDSSNFRDLTLLGSPLPGLNVRVVAEGVAGMPVADRHVGEIQVQGDSLMDGYLDSAEGLVNPAIDGWLGTGDLGYAVEDQLVVTGRAKDVIILYGRNIAAEDIERCVGRVEGVRTGSVAAFAVRGPRGQDELVVAAEVKIETIGLSDAIATEVANALGVRPTDIVVVPPQSIPKTTSGKLQRSKCRELYETGELGAS